jgi:hypothetical protein
MTKRTINDSEKRRKPSSTTTGRFLNIKKTGGTLKSIRREK